MELSQWSKFLLSLLLILFSIACCSKEPARLNLGKHPFNQEAAYYIHQRVYIANDVEGMPSLELGGGSGSGAGVRSTAKYTDVITAGHVCMLPDQMAALGAKQEISLWDIHGESFAARIYAIDLVNDLCIVRIDERRPTLKLAKYNPAVGEKIYSAGYPNGVYMPGLLHFFDGYLGGLGPDRSAFYSIPSSPGSSGSAIVDKRGNIIGIVSAVLTDFHHATIGPSVEPITIFLLLSEHCDKFCVN